MKEYIFDFERIYMIRQKRKKVLSLHNEQEFLKIICILLQYYFDSNRKCGFWHDLLDLAHSIFDLIKLVAT